MILHIDMDAFFASVEQAINPSLKGYPLIVGSRDNKYHTVVCAASYEAKRLGIDSGMPTKEAFKICPQAKFVPADSAKYLYTSESIFDMLRSYQSDLKYSSIDEFDLGFDNWTIDKCIPIAKDIKQRIRDQFNITCSIGIAPNWHLAKLGSKIGKPDGLTAIDKTNYLAILAELPVEKICGVGPALKTKLNLLGIITCGNLIHAPKFQLFSRFGKIANWLSNCLDPDIQETLSGSPDQEKPKSIGHSYTLSKATNNMQIISAWIRLLSEMVAQRLRKSSLEAQTIHIYISNYQNTGFSCQKTFKTGVCLGVDIFMRSMAIVGLKKAHKTGVQALGISVSGLYPRTQTIMAFKEQKEYQIASALDHINERYGDWTIYPANLSLIHNQPKTPK